MTAILVLGKVPHLKEIAGLLRQAAEGCQSPYHERRLRRPATGFEGLLQPVECIASTLEVQSEPELIAVPFLSLSEEDSAEEAGQETQP
jgi:hypothetical protein